MVDDSLNLIVLVGAGRSGTKLLRSILAFHPNIVCFPKEINYIWRYGNAELETDELKPKHARPEVFRYIRSRFEKLSWRWKSHNIVEKTCANSLRVDFVHTIFPKAKIIHIIRDGRAVAESARRCWRARPNIKYLFEKARWVPTQDIPLYALRYLRYQLDRFNKNSNRQASWGPRFALLDDLVKQKTLIEVCGIQWKVCVQAAEFAMKSLPSNQAITIRYEDLVNSPLPTTKQLFNWLEIVFTPECQDHTIRTVVSSNLNKWHQNLSEKDLNLLIPHINTELLRHGYDI
jgi:hypothetical protein